MENWRIIVILVFSSSSRNVVNAQLGERKKRGRDEAELPAPAKNPKKEELRKEKELVKIEKTIKLNKDGRRAANKAKR